MRQIIRFTFLFFTVISLGNCSNTETTEAEETIQNQPVSEEESSPLLSDVEYEAMAEELCTCMKPLVDLQNKVNALSEEEIRAMVDEIQKISDAGDKCVEAIDVKYGKVVGREAEEKAKEAFIKACPYIAGMTSN